MAEGERGVSAVDDHPFDPKTDWWSQCAVCGLAQSAHTDTVLCASCGGTGAFGAPDKFGNYDPCPMCDGTGRKDGQPW